MKKISVVLLYMAVLVGFFVSTASAEVYLSGNLAMVFVNDSDLYDGVDTAVMTTETGFGLIGAIGGYVDKGFRIEAELGYRTNDLKDLSAFGMTVPVNGDISSVSFMGNGYYNFDTGGRFSPYIGAGIGFANVEGNIEGFGKEDDTVFAYQLAAGGDLELQENLSLDLQYRFFATSDPNFSGLEAEYSTHNIMLGLRYAFN